MHKGGVRLWEVWANCENSNLNLFTDQIFTLVTLSRAAIMNSQDLILLPVQIALAGKLEHYLSD